MSQSTAVIILMSLGWLITVACFLLYVRRLRNKAKTMPYGPMAFKQGVPASPIANSEQPVEPVRVFEYKPSEKRHTISDKKVSESAKKSSKNKGFSAKAANKPKQRKTVTVKKR
jgi:hypothetical protein